MKKTLALAICSFIVLAFVMVANAQQWPIGSWKTAVVVTSDDVHKAEAGVEQAGNVFTIKAGGDDIWGNSDQFTFVYKEVSGDFDVAITVLSLEKTNDWAKAGIMCRQDLDPGSINVMAACRGADDLVTYQRRETAGGSSSSERLTPAGAPRPVTIRLMRSGDTFTGGWSLDGGATWEDCVTKDGVTPTPPIELTFTDPILLGIAVTSHQAGVITTAEVELLGAAAVDAAGKVAMTWGKIKSN